MVRRGLIDELFGEGSICTIFSPPGYGKTNLACKLFEKAVQKGYHIYTVINFFPEDQIETALKKGYLPSYYIDPKTSKKVSINYVPKHPNIHVTFYLSKVLEGLLSTKKNNFTLDEAAFFAGSTESMTKKVRQLKLLAYTIRKLNSSLLIIAQSKGSIVPALRDELVEYELRIERDENPKLKPNERRRDLVIYRRVHRAGFEEVPLFQYVMTIRGITPTVYPFDSKFLPKFTMDIDLEEFFDRIGQYNSLEVRKYARSILEELKNESTY